MARNDEAHRRFVEETGDMMEEHGLSHMAGRIFGALQVCVPPHMSMGELAEAKRHYAAELREPGTSINTRSSCLWGSPL